MAFSEVLSNGELSDLPFFDVPFKLSIGNDYIQAGDKNVLGVGDYAVIGLVETDQDVTDRSVSFSEYTSSTVGLRFPTSVESYRNIQEAYNIAVYKERYGNDIKKEVKFTLLRDR